MMISIHALREEGDAGLRPALLPFAEFLSTPSARRATSLSTASVRWISISIHALREEGDSSQIWESKQFSNFYPRPPRGGRLADVVKQRVDFLISIHALREEGDTSPRSDQGENVISIHALREEGDVRTRSRRLHQMYFYPRPPRGGRLDAGKATIMANLFLSTPSARRATYREVCYGV